MVRLYAIKRITINILYQFATLARASKKGIISKRFVVVFKFLQAKNLRTLIGYENHWLSIFSK